MNCQLKEYWVEKLPQIGFKRYPYLSETAREMADGGHYARSGSVFSKCSIMA